MSVAAMVVVDVTIVEPGLVARTGIVSEVVRVAVVMVSLRIAAHVTVIDVKALRLVVVPWCEVHVDLAGREAECQVDGTA